MLAKRIIGSLIVKDGTVVQSFGMSRYLPVGSPEVAVEFLNDWGVDEIVVLNITASEKGEPDFFLVERLAKKTRVPLAVGGGIRTLEHMRRLIAGGADKLVLKTLAKENLELVSKAASIFGDQCIVVSIDVHEGNAGTTEAVRLAVEVRDKGAGEILLRCIERDGSKQGFDLKLVRAVAEAVAIPVIAAGGCGHPTHVKEVFDAGASAAAVGNILHFTEHSVITIKQELRRSGVPIRLDTHATYAQNAFDADGRLLKQDDAVLERLRFEYHPKEII